MNEKCQNFLIMRNLQINTAERQLDAVLRAANYAGAN